MIKNRFVSLLHNHPVLKKLSTIQLFAYMGTWFSTVAIYVLLTQLEASAMLISVIAIMHFLPGIIQAPIAGAIIDKIPFKPLMLTLLVMELVATFGILFIDSLELVWLLMVLIFIRMSGSSFYFTAEMSLMPQLLNVQELKTANELHSIIWSLTYTAGMAVGGLVVYAYGVKVAIIVDLLFFLLSIFIFTRVNVSISIEKSTQKIWVQIKEGLVYIKTNKKILYLLFLHASVGLTAYDALVTLLADIAYKNIISVALSIGIINAVRALGLFIGPMILGRWVTKHNLDFVMVLQALSIFVWGFTQEWFYLSLGAIFLTGLLITSIWSLTYAMLQEATDKAFLGRVISYNEMGFMGMSALTSFIIGFLFDYFGLPLHYVTYVLGALFLSMALYYRKIKHLF